VLGGSLAEEAEVFGSVAGPFTRASALTVRVIPDPTQQPWKPVEFTSVSNTGYLLYFAKASANETRWVPGGALPVGSTFELAIHWRRPLSERNKARFDLALDSFLMLGSLGLRGTRGLGAFECREMPFSEDSFKQLVARINRSCTGFLCGLGAFQGPESRLLDALGAQLNGLRQRSPAGDSRRPNRSPLGSSEPRQASAVCLRPVKIANPAEFRIVVFEAPAERVLGKESRQQAPLLKDGIPAPINKPQDGRQPRGGFRR
jgi:CRISPR/Cas system CMR-associated protein Cmr1 (group 7 of RAMP superfamily)